MYMVHVMCLHVLASHQYCISLWSGVVCISGQLYVSVITLPSGMTLFALHRGGAVLTGENLQGVDFTISSALLFGTICAAVDPVAVSRCVKERGKE